MSSHDGAGASRLAVTGKLLVATIGGAVFFLLPVRWDGSWTVPFDVAVSSLTDDLPGMVRAYTLVVVLGALALTVAAHTPLAARSGLVAAFGTSPIMLVLRVAGAALALMIVTGTGPSAILDPGVGELMYDDLASSVAVIVPIGAVFITLFVAFSAA